MAQASLARRGANSQYAGSEDKSSPCAEPPLAGLERETSTAWRHGLPILLRAPQIPDAYTKQKGNTNVNNSQQITISETTDLAILRSYTHFRIYGPFSRGKKILQKHIKFAYNFRSSQPPWSPSTHCLRIHRLQLKNFRTRRNSSKSMKFWNLNYQFKAIGTCEDTNI